MDDNIVQANEILQQQNSDQLFKNLLGYAVSLSSKGQNIVNNYIGSAKNYKFFSLSWLDVTVSVIFLTLTAGYWSIHMPDVDSAIVLDNSFSYFDSEYVRMLCFFSQIIDLNREMQSNYSYTLSQEEEMLTSKNKTPNILRNNSNSRYNTSPYLYYVLMFFFLLPFILSIHLTSFFNSWTDSFSYISVKFKELVIETIFYTLNLFVFVIFVADSNEAVGSDLSLFQVTSIKNYSYRPSQKIFDIENPLSQSMMFDERVKNRKSQQNDRNISLQQGKICHTCLKSTCLQQLKID
ncbi:MAG: hypothetical protein MHPSP_000368 [Paramarteilia canceri]